MLQEMGFTCETGGNWSSREEESKVLHLDYMAYTPVPRPSYEGRESNRFLAHSRWDELVPLQLGMEDDTLNLIGVQRGLGDI